MRHFLEASAGRRLMVVMVQKEVGKAIVAEPGDMSLLAVSVQFYGRPSIVARVPARSFYPPPKVDSVILRVDVYDRPPVDVPGARAFFDTVRAGFSAPRKQLRNSLAQGLAVGAEEAAGLLQRAGDRPQRRAETLSIEEWGRLCGRGPQLSPEPGPVTRQACAKINLTFEVLGKRLDGYHEIASVMQAISLCDVLTFDTGDDIRLACDVAELASPSNLVFRAARLMQGLARGRRPGAAISLRKGIPLAGGLGGGSSDAAAACRP